MQRLSFPVCAQLATRLQVNTYPCVALLQQQGSATLLVSSIEGQCSAAKLLQELRRAVDHQGPQLVAARAAEQERVRGHGRGR